MPTKTFVSLNNKKQDLIFQVALQEFADCGYTQASTNTICKKAGISKGSMFQYFPNKEDLFMEGLRDGEAYTYMIESDVGVDIRKNLFYTLAEKNWPMIGLEALGMNLDMSRGKPCQEQLDLSMGMMDVLDSSSDLTCEDGTDCRNYGQLTGILEARELLGDMMENNPKDIIIK